MDTALTQKFPFILDRNLAKDNCTENHVCTSCDTVVLGASIKYQSYQMWKKLTNSDMKYAFVLLFIFILNPSHVFQMEHRMVI